VGHSCQPGDCWAYIDAAEPSAPTDEFTLTDAEEFDRLRRFIRELGLDVRRRMNAPGANANKDAHAILVLLDRLTDAVLKVAERTGEPK
jgi:hypothetical protein